MTADNTLLLALATAMEAEASMREEEAKVEDRYLNRGPLNAARRKAAGDVRLVAAALRAEVACACEEEESPR